MTKEAALGAMLLGVGLLFGCDDGNNVEDLPKVDLPADDSADASDAEADDGAADGEAEPEPAAEPKTPEDFAKIAEEEITEENAAEVADELLKTLEAELAELGE